MHATGSDAKEVSSWADMSHTPHTKHLSMPYWSMYGSGTLPFLRRGEARALLMLREGLFFGGGGVKYVQVC